MATRAVLRLTFLSLLVCSIYGFLSHHLLRQELWVRPGPKRLAYLVIAYAATALVFYLWRPAWFAKVLVIFAGLYTIGAVGIAAPVAVLYFLFSSLCLGRRLLPPSNASEEPENSLDTLIAMVGGMCVYITLFGITAHFGVNYPVSYLLIMGLPIAAAPRLTIRISNECTRLFRSIAVQGKWEFFCFALLGLALVAHWLVVLKPEVSSDGLAMHLVVPAYVLVNHLWSFDFQNIVWAVMPMGGDWAFTAVYLLGGEFAARLLNLAALLVNVAFLVCVVRASVPRPLSYLAAATFASVPVVQLVTGSLFVENIWACTAMAAVVCIARFHESGRSRYLYLVSIVLGTSLAIKFGAIGVVIPMALLIVLEVFRARRIDTFFRVSWPVILACFLGCALVPYAYAHWKTGNPVFPFMNAVFRSRWYNPESVVDLRFRSPLSWSTLYDLTYASHKFLEGQDGSFGFQYLILLPLTLLCVRKNWPHAGLISLFLSLVFFMIVFVSRSYIRYIYPALPLITVSIALMIGRIRDRDRVLYVMLCASCVAAVCLNIYFLPASGWYHRSFYLNPLKSVESERYVESSAPARKLVELLNIADPAARVAFFGTADIAGLRGYAVTNSWHSDRFWRRLLSSGSPASIAKLAEEYRLKYFIAPAPQSGIELVPAMLSSFLAQYTEPMFIHGTFCIARWKQQYMGNGKMQSAPDGGRPYRGIGFSPQISLPAARRGSYDDLDPRVIYEGPWFHDTQFPEASNGTVTSCDLAECSARLSFVGDQVSYVYTKAFNRGIVEVAIDGVSRARIDLYSPNIEWQSVASFEGLGPRNHSIVVRVASEKNPASRGFLWMWTDLKSVDLRQEADECQPEGL